VCANRNVGESIIFLFGGDYVKLHIWSFRIEHLEFINVFLNGEATIDRATLPFCTELACQQLSLL
jgi:hypothetical protein